jgi:hypothetical protein
MKRHFCRTPTPLVNRTQSAKCWPNDRVGGRPSPVQANIHRESQAIFAQTQRPRGAPAGQHSIMQSGGAGFFRRHTQIGSKSGEPLAQTLLGKVGHSHGHWHFGMYSSLAEVRAATWGHIISAATTRQAFVSPSCPYALRFLVIPKSAFRQCLSEHPELSIALLKELSGRMRKLTECTKRLALMDVYGRIVATLHSMAHEEAGNTVVTQRLTHQDIADRSAPRARWSAVS